MKCEAPSSGKIQAVGMKGCSPFPSGRAKLLNTRIRGRCLGARPPTSLACRPPDPPVRPEHPDLSQVASHKRGETSSFLGRGGAWPNPQAPDPPAAALSHSRVPRPPGVSALPGPGRAPPHPGRAGTAPRPAPRPRGSRSPAPEDVVRVGEQQLGGFQEGLRRVLAQLGHRRGRGVRGAAQRRRRHA